MTGVSHLLIGGSLAFTATSFVSKDPTFLFFNTILGSLATLLPDLDAQNSVLQVWLTGKYSTKISDSLISRYQRRGSLVMEMIYLGFASVETAIRLIMWLLISGLKKITTHRGITHSLFTFLGLLVIVTVAIELLTLDPLYLISFSLGYISHLFADATTYSGVQLLAPFSKQSLHILPKKYHYKTGSGTEYIILSGVLTCCLTLGLIGYYFFS